jgi:hypothetical protein
MNNELSQEIVGDSARATEGSEVDMAGASDNRAAVLESGALRSRVFPQRGSGLRVNL